MSKYVLVPQQQKVSLTGGITNTTKVEFVGLSDLKSRAEQAQKELIESAMSQIINDTVAPDDDNTEASESDKEMHEHYIAGESTSPDTKLLPDGKSITTQYTEIFGESQAETPEDSEV